VYRNQGACCVRGASYPDATWLDLTGDGLDAHAESDTLENEPSRLDNIQSPAPWRIAQPVLHGVLSVAPKPVAEGYGRARLEVHAPQIYLGVQESAIIQAFLTIDRVQAHAETGRSVPLMPYLLIHARIYTRWKMWTT
jgi:hypothetical protein